MDATHGGISRRRVLVGAAWTAPAILIATSVPARAASGDVVTGAPLTFNNVSIFPENNGNIGGNFSYRINWVSGVPSNATLTTYWSVVAVNNADSSITKSQEGGPVVLTNAGSSGTYAIEMTGVPLGEYTVTVTVTSDPYVDPDTHTTYIAADLVETEVITVT